ncbi:MAG: siderophore-interacting protein [Arthrobacter sp.]
MPNCRNASDGCFSTGSLVPDTGVRGRGGGSAGPEPALPPHHLYRSFTAVIRSAGPTLDLHIKMLLPSRGHALQLPGTPDGVLRTGWYRDWLRQDQPGRGFIRSNTIRALRQGTALPEIDVDIVLHDCPGSHDGPGSTWARGARPGQPVWFVGPDAAAVTAATPLPEAGINWKPGDAQHVLLAGDETAVPAISSILEALPEHFTGDAFLGPASPP